MENYLYIKDLQVSFRSFEGVQNVVNIDELRITQGHAFGLVGESGSGKSVTAFALQHLLTVPPAIIKAEHILLDGEDIFNKTQKEMTKIRGRKLAMIFQDPMSTLNPVFTVGAQIESVIRRIHKFGTKEAHRMAVEMIGKVQLPDAEDVLKKYPHELSGGQRQRIIIAIALVCGAGFLIADEPTRNLDVTTQAGIMKLLATLRQEQKLTVLFITNNLSLVPLICDEVGLIYQGQILECGTVAEVIDKPMHPYTLALIQPLPRTQEEKEAVKQTIAESQPVKRGCIYQNKCLRCMDVCRGTAPEMILIEGTHKVRCHLFTKGVGQDD